MHSNTDKGLEWVIFPVYTVYETTPQGTFNKQTV